MVMQFSMLLESKSLLCEVPTPQGSPQKTEINILLKFMHFTTIALKNEHKKKRNNEHSSIRIGASYDQRLYLACH